MAPSSALSRITTRSAGSASTTRSRTWRSESGITEIGCDVESKFCTAAVNVLPGVLAVWTVWPDEQRAVTARAMADTQGAAIVQFVRRGLATVEDPTLADAK